MTYKEFKETFTEYRVADYCNRYKTVINETKKTGNTELVDCIYRCYANLLTFSFIRELEESKVANKPINYKVVQEFIIKLNNDEHITLRLRSPELYCSNYTYMGVKLDYNYTFDQKYVPTKKEDNRCIDYEQFNNCEYAILEPEKIKAFYEAKKIIDKTFIDAINELKKTYNEAMKELPYMGLGNLWVDIK